MPLPIEQKLTVFAGICKLKLIEFVRFDSTFASIILMLAYLVEYYILRLFKRPLPVLCLAGKIFRHAQLPFFRDYASGILRSQIDKYGPKTVGHYFSQTSVIDRQRLLHLRNSVLNGVQPFDKRLIILSPPKNGARGVLLVKFTENFIYLSRVFDLDKLLLYYIIVLEPSFSGYFNPAILYLMGKASPVIIQASERVDYKFIESLHSNLVPVDLGANCWVDDTTFYPISNTEKQYDIIMVSLWADFKRHYHLFQALSKAKNKDRIRVALVGVPWPKSLQQIEKIAQYYGVDQQIHYFEHLSQQAINKLLNMSKVYLLLSKKEGVNKGIIESLFAGTPGFLLEGFNYGQHYHYINKQTGGFIHPSKLTNFIDNIDSILEKGHFSPNTWVKSHMTVANSMGRLRMLLSEIEIGHNLRINKEMQAKINTPDCDYQDKSYWQIYSEYYRDLNRYLRYAL